MSHSIFTDAFLEALGSWQNGWGEDQVLRLSLAAALVKEAQSIPPKFRAAPAACYRKRFLASEDVIPLLLRSLHDGVTSWSIDRKLAEEFKYRLRPGTIAGVVFQREPHEAEIVVNIPALWADPGFVTAAEGYRDRGQPGAVALFNFLGARDQREVVLDAPLNPEDIVSISGETDTSFEEFCKAAKLPVLLEDEAWKALLAKDLQPQAPSFVRDQAAQAVVLRAVAALERLLERVRVNRTHP